MKHCGLAMRSLIGAWTGKRLFRCVRCGHIVYEGTT